MFQFNLEGKPLDVPIEVKGLTGEETVEESNADENEMRTSINFMNVMRRVSYITRLDKFLTNALPQIVRTTHFVMEQIQVTLFYAMPSATVKSTTFEFYSKDTPTLPNLIKSVHRLPTLQITVIVATSLKCSGPRLWSTILSLLILRLSERKRMRRRNRRLRVWRLYTRR